MTAPLSDEDRALVAFLRGPILRGGVETRVANMTDIQLADTASLFGSVRAYLAIFDPASYGEKVVTKAWERAA